ncbi:MAG: HAD-IIIA family hydrolase [Treponema sp.]|nr:HAD-IIIA family hydrolase [Treponema sp.]
MRTIIMAGGKGTRIASIASDIPKPMIKLCGKPILEHQIECLKRNGLKDITLVIGHLGHFIREYFEDGSRFGVKISYYEETEPLGTAGALYKIEGLIDSGEDFLLLCGDTIFDLDFSRLTAFHKAHNADATLVAHPNGHPYDSSLLVTEILPPAKEGEFPQDTRRVTKWMNKEDERLWYKNRVNAGIEMINPRLLLKAKEHLTKEKIDLDRDILKPAVADGHIFAYDTPEYIKDMGTPDRYYATEADIKSGLVSQRNLSHKQKAIFLDRDGTINKFVGFLTKIDGMELLAGAAEAIKKINDSGYLAIVVTNQPAIARGEIDFPDLQEIHNKLETLLGKEGAYLDAIYYCPHHTDKGFEGERIAYKCNCDCRKPKAGMLLQAAKDFNIDLSQSYMIGDSQRDLEAGKNAGCKESILLEDGKSLADIIPAIVN